MRAILLSTCLLAAIPSVSAAAQDEAIAGNVQPVRKDDQTLFQIRLANDVLSDAVIVHGDPNDPLLPVGELSRLLGLNVSVQPTLALATGRLGEAERPLIIDIRHGEGRSGQAGVAIGYDDAQVSGTEIFLRASLFRKLFPLTIAVDTDSLTIDLAATEKLPIQASAERRDRWAKLGQDFAAEDKVFDVAVPYQWISRPGFDGTIGLGYDSSTRRSITRFEARAAMDVLGAGLTTYLATDEDAKPNSARIMLEKRSISGDMLGPLGLTRMALGDVYSPDLPVGPRSMGGAGFSFSNADLTTTSAFERIDIQGQLPLGYDVELYVNDVLRSGQNKARDGRYEFLDVPLVRGVNVVRVVTYGPHGERRDSTRVINVGSGQLAAGQTVFEGGLVFQNRPVIDLNGDSFDSLLAKRGKPRAVLSIAHGLTPTLTAEIGGATWTDGPGRSRKLLSGGLRTSLLGFALQLDHAREFSHGSATSLRFAGRLAGISLNGRHAEYAGDFVDENMAYVDVTKPNRRYSELLFDLTIPWLSSHRLPLSGAVQRMEYKDGETQWVARGRTTLSVADTLVGVGLDYNRRSDSIGTNQRFSGSISASRLIDYKWQLRASANYEFEPESRLQNIAFTVDRALGGRHSLRLGASKSFGDSDNVSIIGGFTSAFSFGELSFNADYSTGLNAWRAGLQFNFGFGPKSRSSSYGFSRTGPGSGGSAALHAFRDTNGNGVYDQGEEGVEGIVLQGAGRDAATDRNGRAYVTGLGDGPVAVLHANLDNVDTVFDATPPTSISVEARPGSVARIDYPITPTSEVVARINFRQDDGQLAGISAIKVLLVPATGDPIPAITEFDGTVVFDQIRAGRYTLKLEAEQAAILGMRLTCEPVIDVKADGRPVRIATEILFAKASINQSARSPSNAGEKP